MEILYIRLIVLKRMNKWQKKNYLRCACVFFVVRLSVCVFLRDCVCVRICLCVYISLCSFLYVFVYVVCVYMRIDNKTNNGSSRRDRIWVKYRMKKRKEKKEGWKFVECVGRTGKQLLLKKAKNKHKYNMSGIRVRVRFRLRVWGFVRGLSPVFGCGRKEFWRVKYCGCNYTFHFFSSWVASRSESTFFLLWNRLPMETNLYTCKKV